MVNVHAKDLGTGREQNIRIVASSGLTESDIERIIGEADAYKTTDQKRRELAELRNAAEALLYTSERAVAECRELVAEEVVAQVEADIQSLHVCIEEGDAIARLDHCHVRRDLLHHARGLHARRKRRGQRIDPRQRQPVLRECIAPAPPTRHR